MKEMRLMMEGYFNNPLQGLINPNTTNVVASHATVPVVGWLLPKHLPPSRKIMMAIPRAMGVWVRIMLPHLWSDIIVHPTTIPCLISIVLAFLLSLIL
jgi:hypothetical protein